MPLSRHRRISRVWNWLPAFRAVAEYESIQRAALALSVSPSALSRMMRILEEELGYSVFSRSPGGTTLTPAGARLVEGTRDAMRRVDEALPLPANRLVVCSDSALLLPTLAAALTTISELATWSLTIQQVATRDIAAQLRRGEVDFAVFTTPPDNGAGLEVIELVTMPWVIAGAQTDDLVAVDGPWGPALAKCVAPSLEAATCLAAGLKLGLLAPRFLVPAALPIRKTLAHQFAVFVAKRPNLFPNQAAYLTALTQSVHRALLVGQVRVDEVV